MSPYTGTKFKTVFEKKGISSDKKIPLLKKWGEIFSELGLAPKCEGGYGGNLSFKTEKGFIITAAGSDLGNLKDNDFTEVIALDISDKMVYVKGVKEPSSESMLHNEVYKRRTGVKAVLHGHDALVLRYNKKLNFPITKKEEPYGSIELMREVIKVLNQENYILMKNHGFLSLGKTIEEAGKKALSSHDQALAFSKLSFS